MQADGISAQSMRKYITAFFEKTTNVKVFPIIEGYVKAKYDVMEMNPEVELGSC